MPEERVSHEELAKLVTRVVQQCDTSYSSKDAVEWAAGYEFPVGIVEKDTQDLERHGGDFTLLVRERHAHMLSDRMNIERLGKWPEDDPNIDILRGLVPGMRVPVDSRFEPACVPPKPREKYLKVAPAVNKMVTALAEQGLAVLLPTSVAIKIPGIHYSPISWVPKSNKAQGRPVVDSSWAENGRPLNTPEVSKKVEEMYGKINHPTVTDLVEMILRQVDVHGWEDLCLWKMDLANAFGLLFIHPEDCKLMAFELTGGITVLYMVGIFGWTGTPFAFDPISRSLRFVLRRQVDGGLDMFVDDLMGCTRSSSLQNDMSKAAVAIYGLLGSKAVAEEKSLHGRVLEFIGWEVDLNKRVISAAPKNLYKALYGFCMTDLSKTVTINRLEQLASWASRYSLICRPLSPFVHGFYRNIPYDEIEWRKRETVVSKFKSNSRGYRNFEVEWNEEAKLDVILWRAFLCLAHLRPEGFARPIHSFRKAQANLSIEFDASLDGFGFITGRDIRFSKTPAVWCGYMHTYDFDRRDSSYQNTMEYIAVVLAIGSLILSGIRGASVLLIGDSTTALSWAVTEKTKSPKTRRAATMMLLLTTKFNITIAGERWLSGEDNFACDSLSRSVKPETMSGHEDILNVERSDWMMELVNLCDPTEPCVNEEQFTELWKRANDLCRSV